MWAAVMRSSRWFVPLQTRLGATGTGDIHIDACRGSYEAARRSLSAHK
jgi:hypothetical protein